MVDFDVDADVKVEWLAQGEEAVAISLSSLVELKIGVSLDRLREEDDDDAGGGGGGGRANDDMVCGGLGWYGTVRCCVGDVGEKFLFDLRKESLF